MKTKLTIALFVFLFSSFLTSLAQESVIVGKVVDESTGYGVPSVTVYDSIGMNGSMTDTDGVFFIKTKKVYHLTVETSMSSVSLLSKSTTMMSLLSESLLVSSVWNTVTTSEATSLVERLR